MPFVNDLALDAAVGWFTANVTRLDICSQEPTSYTEATSTYTLGNKTGLTMTGPSDSSSPAGRAATVPAVSDGTVTSNGTASHWAISKPTATTALGATGSLSSSQSVSTVVPFSLTTFDVVFRDAA